VASGAAGLVQPLVCVPGPEGAAQAEISPVNKGKLSARKKPRPLFRERFWSRWIWFGWFFESVILNIVRNES